ncbi:MAG: N-acetyltransferase [Candidatus Synoicihabitans palmerolidicus]|nr:N-acetyltransferase [Candidatus Synoicihabitans palmerolidicus]
MRSKFNQTAGRDYPFYVAKVAGEVVGYGYIGPFRERRAYQFTVEDSIYLHPDKTGRGLGRLLLNKLIGASTQRGFKQMIALIGDSYNRVSVRLHSTSGFVHTGTLQNVGQKVDRWLDVVVIQRSLDDK